MGQVRELDHTDIDQMEDAELVTEERRELLRDRHLRDVHRLMAERWGRRIVRRLLDDNFFYRTHASNNGVESQRAEGRRQVVLDLRDAIARVCPDALDLMEQEHRKDMQDREQANGD